MDLVWLCLCLGVGLLSSGIDAVKLIPIHTKTVKTDGATHDISRYIVVPDDYSNERNDDVTLKKIQLQSEPISHSSNDGEPNISKLLGINTGKSDDDARDIVNSKVVQYSKTVNSPSSIKYHLVLGGKSEADKVSENNRNLDLFNMNDGAKTKGYSMTAITQNQEAKFDKDRNNEKAQTNANGGSTNWSYNIRESSLVPNVGVEKTQKVQKIIKAENEVETQRSGEQSSPKETADDHKTIKHFQTKTVTKTKHKPITKIKLKDLPIKWDTASDNQIGPHPLLSSIAINKTFTLPGKRGRFKLIYEDDDDIDTVIDNQVFKQNTDPMTVARTHYYINNYSIDSSNKKATDGIHLNNDLSLGSPTIKSNEQTDDENNAIQLSVPKFNILSTSTPDGKVEISTINSGNSFDFTNAHTVSPTKNEGSGDHKLTIKTTKIIQGLGDNRSKQVHTSYGYLSDSSATNQNKDLVRKAASNNYSDDENSNLRHTVVTKYITNTNESPLKSDSSNISLQNREEPTPIATKTKSTVVSKSRVQQEPKHKDDFVTSSDTETYVHANPEDDDASRFGPSAEENTASESLNDHELSRTTSNVIKIINMSPINHSQFHVIPLNHKTDINESSHIERVIIIPTVHKNSTTVVTTSKTNKGDHSSNGLLDNNNDGTKSPVSHTNQLEFIPDTEKTADTNIVKPITESRNVSMYDIIHIPSSKTNTKETDPELDSDIHKFKISVDTNYTSDNSLSDQNKVANIDSPINEIVPLVDKTTHELSVDTNLSEQSSQNHFIIHGTKLENKENDDTLNYTRATYWKAGTGDSLINTIDSPHGLKSTDPTSSESTNVQKKFDDDENKNMVSETEMNHVAVNVLNNKREDVIKEEGYRTINALEDGFLKATTLPTFDKMAIEQNNDDNKKNKHTILRTDISHEAVKPTYNRKYVVNYQSNNRDNEGNEEDNDDTINDQEKESLRIETDYSSVSQNEIPEGVTTNSLSSKEVTIVPETDEKESSISKTQNSDAVVKTQNRINVLDYLGTRHSEHVKEDENEESINDLKQDSARTGAGSLLINQNITPTYATTASSTNENVLDDVDSHGNGDVTVDNHRNVIHYLGYSHSQNNIAVENEDSINDSREDTARMGVGSLRINQNIIPKHATTAALMNKNMLNDVDSHDKRKEEIGEEDNDTINALEGGYIKATTFPAFDKMTIEQNNYGDNKNKHTILKTNISNEAVKPTHNYGPVINSQSINRDNEGNEEDNDDTINDKEKESHRIETGYSSLSQNETPEGVTTTSLSSKEVTIVPKTYENESSISNTQISDVAVKTQKLLNVLDYLRTRNSKDIKEIKSEDSINDSREDSARMDAGSLLINENITLATTAAPINENVSDDVGSHENGDVPVENHTHVIHNVGYRYSKNNKAGENEDIINDSVEDTTRMGADYLLINQNRAINDITTTMPTSNYITILPGELNSDEMHDRQNHINLLINTLSNGIPETNTEYAKNTPQAKIRIDDSYSTTEINSPKSVDNKNIKFQLGSPHHKQQTNSEIIDDLASNSVKKYYNGNGNGENKYPMHTEQSENVSPFKAMISDYYDEDGNSSESDEYEIPTESRAKEDYETHHKDYARPNRIIYQKKLTESKVKTVDTNDKQYLGVATENIPYAPENSYAINTMVYGPSHIYDSKKISKYNEYVSYVLKYLISINIIPEINAYCASIEPGVVKNEIIMQIIIKHLHELGIHKQSSLEHFYMLAQHLVHLIEGHSSIRCKTNKKHKNDDKILPIVISNRYYAIPYAYVYAKSDALNQNKKVQDKAKLQQLLDSVNLNVGYSQASNVKSKILKVIKYLRNLKVPEAKIIEFITEVNKYLSTELIESHKAECQSRICSSLVKRIDMIGIKYLPDCHKQFIDQPYL